MWEHVVSQKRKERHIIGIQQKQLLLPLHSLPSRWRVEGFIPKTAIHPHSNNIPHQYHHISFFLHVVPNSNGCHTLSNVLAPVSATTLANRWEAFFMDWKMSLPLPPPLLLIIFKVCGKKVIWLFSWGGRVPICIVPVYINIYFGGELMILLLAWCYSLKVPPCWERGGWSERSRLSTPLVNEFLVDLDWFKYLSQAACNSLSIFPTKKTIVCRTIASFVVLPPPIHTDEEIDLHRDLYPNQNLPYIGIVYIGERLHQQL